MKSCCQTMGPWVDDGGYKLGQAKNLGRNQFCGPRHSLKLS